MYEFKCKNGKRIGIDTDPLNGVSKNGHIFIFPNLNETRDDYKQVEFRFGLAFNVTERSKVDGDDLGKKYATIRDVLEAADLIECACDDIGRRAAILFIESIYRRCAYSEHIIRNPGHHIPECISE